MKKTIVLILVSLFIYGCSTSGDPNSNSTPVVHTPTYAVGPNVTDIDGNTYQSTTICGQTWTKQNLNVSKYTDGTSIPQITNTSQWSSLTTGAWCYCTNITDYGAVYGKIYNWYAVVGIYDAASAANPSLRKKLAPSGWHIPNDAEWTTLTDCLGGLSVAGGKMKEAGNEHWIAPNTGATNESGFTGLPAGEYLGLGMFSGIGQAAYWWSSTMVSPSGGYAWSRDVNGSNPKANRGQSSVKLGYSVRCVKD